MARKQNKLVSCLTECSGVFSQFKWAVLGQSKVRCGPGWLALFQMAPSGLGPPTCLHFPSWAVG